MLWVRGGCPNKNKARKLATPTETKPKKLATQDKPIRPPRPKNELTGGGSQRGLEQLFLHPLLRIVVVPPGRLPPLLTVVADAGEGVDVGVFGVDVGLASWAPVGDVMRERLGSARSTQGVLCALLLPPPSSPRPLGCRNLGPNVTVLLLDNDILVLLLLILLRVYRRRAVVLLRSR